MLVFLVLFFICVTHDSFVTDAVFSLLSQLVVRHHNAHVCIRGLAWPGDWLGKILNVTFNIHLLCDGVCQLQEVIHVFQDA